MWLDYFNIINRAGKPNSMDVIIGTLLTLLVLEATRRVCGMALPILGVIFILYSLMGTKQGLIPVNIPGIFLHRGYTLSLIHIFFCAGFQIVATNYFQATGQPLKATVLSMLRQLLLLVPLILILPLFFGLDGILYAGPAADVGSALVVACFIVPEVKKLNRHVAEEKNY